MASIIVAFESRYGHTQKIAEHIADRARGAGHDAWTLRASAATSTTVDRADGFVVVAPIYYGRHPRQIERFLRSYVRPLSKRPLAFVSVSNSEAHAHPNAKANARHMAHQPLVRLGLRPRVVASVAGAIAYPRYGFFLRQLMRALALVAGLPVSTHRVHELTDWDALDRDLEPFFTASELSAAKTRGSSLRADAPI